MKLYCKIFKRKGEIEKNIKKEEKKEKRSGPRQPSPGQPARPI
jgi:hypothetical protein